MESKCYANYWAYPLNGKGHYMGIEAINQVVDFRHKTSDNLKENILPACVSDPHIGVVGQQERSKVPCRPFTSITTPPEIHHKPMLVCDSIWQYMELQNVMIPLQYGAVGTVQAMKVPVFVSESFPQTTRTIIL